MTSCFAWQQILCIKLDIGHIHKDTSCSADVNRKNMLEHGNDKNVEDQEMETKQRKFIM